MQSNFIPYKNSSIHYCLYGKGVQFVFCFHGYGGNAESFAFLEERLGEDYTLAAIDLPFHGQTEWNDGLNFEPAELVEIIKQIKAIIQPNSPSTDQKITLLGYSMGGRVALHLLQIIPEALRRVVLIAPDGLHKSLWYAFSTQTWLGNKVFRRAMHKPARFFWVLKMAERYKLVHASIVKVTHYYMDDATKRSELYKRWTTMRRFKPNLGLLKKIIPQNKIAVRFLFGKYDNIILSEKSVIFKDDENIEINIIEAGHRLMQEKYSGEITRLFY